MRSLLCLFGHIASYRELMDAFHGQDSAITPLRLTGPSRTAIRLRQNVYVCTHLDDDALTAAQIGGWLDCITVLARHGLPVGDASLRHNNGSTGRGIPRGGRHDCLHLRLRRNDGRASARRRETEREIRTHWTPARQPVATAEAARSANRRRPELSRLEMPLEEALRQALTSCLTVAESLAVIEALLPRVGAENLAQIIELVPQHTRTRLRRAGLPLELDDALETLSWGNNFYAP